MATETGVKVNGGRRDGSGRKRRYVTLKFEPHEIDDFKLLAAAEAEGLPVETFLERGLLLYLRSQGIQERILEIRQRQKWARMEAREKGERVPPVKKPPKLRERRR